MVADPQVPTRAEFEAFLGKDFRMIRSLERLFEVAGDLTPNQIEDIFAAIQSNSDAIDKNAATLWASMTRAPDVTKHELRGVLCENVKFVCDKYDFPAAVSGVITLEDNTTYAIGSNVDLEGDRIVCAANNSFVGNGTNVSTLTSTGLTGNPLITSTGTLLMRFLEIKDVDEAINISSTSSDFIDWVGVNFTNVPTVGLVENVSNAIFINIGLINAANWTFDGTIGTIGFGDSIFIGVSGQTSIIIPSTATITRRFRAKFCAFVTPSGATGIDFDASATVPDEAYILFECNFSGGGTNLSGLDNTSNSSRFTGNSGILNSRYFAQYYMTSNATVTTIAVSTPTKAAGTTTANPDSEKFSHSNNRATYTGAFTRNFKVEANTSLTSNNNNILRLYIAKNGTAITSSFGESTSNTTGKAEGIYHAVAIPMDTNDYVEAFVSNETGNNNITAVNLNVIVSEL